ncbi:hypothetical protein COCON_G00192180 [Conger conger]|uniref:5'-3' exonuclease PLD3 n=1 Tax=Conger conger TaxID=82655 RepID=A0A9Q1D3R8_CONCO|nr:hypothetical protein COCON_G00192180 [Conger conger]
MSTGINTDVPYEKLASLKALEEEESQHGSAGLKYYWFALLVSSLLLATMILQALLAPVPAHRRGPTCSDPCRFALVESIPEGLTFNSSTTNPSIYNTWLDLISEAQSSLDIASFYWTLTNKDTGTREQTADQGEHILAELSSLAKESGVSVRIAVSMPQETHPQEDLVILQNAGADVRKVNMQELTSGVLHTKFWVVDKRRLHGLAWTPLTQVKELGAVVYNCSCLAEDLGKIFEAYWYLGEPGKAIPSHWPANYSTSYNKDTPMALSLNGTLSSTYLSGTIMFGTSQVFAIAQECLIASMQSAPPALCADGRTQDLSAILSVIEDAHHFVYIAVMNYLPTMEFSHPKRYWSDIDTQLRAWPMSGADPKSKLDIQVKLFVVPANPRQKEIPYARVNHNKYMVTDKVAYIGTSNWSGDYFLHTAGSALVVNQTAAQTTESTVQEQLQAVFERDWNSSYSTPINQHTDLHTRC